MNDQPLRMRQQEATRVAIVEAYLDLAHADGAAAISIPAVADASGVSVRTIYRYFATKGDLVDAAAHHMSTRALAGGDIYATSALELVDNLKLLWVSLAEQMGAVVAEHSSPAGRAIRRTRLGPARAAVAAALGGEADQEAIDMIVAVTSSSMLFELVDRMGHAPEVAAAMASRVAQLILDDATSNNARSDRETKHP